MYQLKNPKALHVIPYLFSICYLHSQGLEQEVGLLKERTAKLSEQGSMLEQQLQMQEQHFHSKLTELQSVK